MFAQTVSDNLRIRSMKTILLIITILIIQCSCTSKKNQKDFDSNPSEIASEPTFEELYFGPIGMILDTLSIVFYHENCGEWGGNQERLYLIRDDQHRLTARLIADTVNCKEIIDVNEMSVLDDSKRVVIFDSTKYINTADEDLISNMLCGIVNAYFDGTPGESSEYYIKIEDSFGSFYLERWGIADLSYIETRKALFGKVYV